MMGLNISKGNMYPFVTHTWNTVKGVCPHGCYYCYMKDRVKNPMYFDKKELKTDLGEGNFIFVGSSCDMWLAPSDDILRTLSHCNRFKNKYLFQSKNTRKYYGYAKDFPEISYLGTTIETNRTYPQMGRTIRPQERAEYMHHHSFYFPTMVTIEPIMDFDITELLNLIHMCNPEWVNIGADSKGHKLPEPNKHKINTLIEELKKQGVDVKIKQNLKRITK